MKVTKYPHRYTISMSEVEFEALKFLVSLGNALPSSRTHSELPRTVQRVLNSERWATLTGPLTVDVQAAGRGGYGQ